MVNVRNYFTSGHFNHCGDSSRLSDIGWVRCRQAGQAETGRVSRRCARAGRGDSLRLGVHAHLLSAWFRLSLAFVDWVDHRLSASCSIWHRSDIAVTFAFVAPVFLPIRISSFSAIYECLGVVSGGVGGELSLQRNSRKVDGIAGGSVGVLLGLGCIGARGHRLGNSRVKGLWQWTIDYRVESRQGALANWRFYLALVITTSSGSICCILRVYWIFW